MPANFIGTHHNNCTDLVHWTNDLQPAVVTLMDIDLTAIEDAMAVSPSTTFFVRVPPDDGLDIHAPLNDLFVEAVRRLEPAINRLVTLPGTPYLSIVLVPYNEPTIKTREEMDRYNTLSLQLMEWADAGGPWKLGIGGFAEGNPPIGLWKLYEPALTYASKNDHWLTLHEYDWPNMLSSFPWRTGRVLQLLHGNFNFPPGKVTPADIYPGLPEPIKSKISIAITECGLDGTKETPRGQDPWGWKSRPQLSPHAYYQQILTYVRRIVREPQIKGVCIYQQGDHAQWENFEISRLKHTMQSEPQPIYDDPVVTPVPPEEPPMTVISRPAIGLHLRNGRLSQREFELIGHAGIEAVKVMSPPVTPYTDIDALHKAFPKLPMTMRLYHPRLRNCNIVPATRYCTDMGQHIQIAMGLGVRDFVIHNEPNHKTCLEGWTDKTRDAYAFRAWYRHVRKTLQSMFPEARFQFPGLALHHNDKRWWNVNRHQIEETEALSVHCYWQRDNWDHYDWGQRHLQARAKFNNHEFPFYIGEFGDSDPEHNEHMIAHTITKWYRAQSAYPYIKASYAYISSSPDPAWSQFAWRNEAGRFKPVVEAVRNMDRGTVFMPAQIGKFMPRNNSVKPYPHRSLDDIKGIAWHHAAVVTDASGIWDYHVRHYDWYGAGYTFLIDFDLTVYQLWPLTTVSNHTANFNTPYVGVCYNGSYMHEPPSVAMLQRGRQLKAYLEARLGKKLKSKRHFDLDPSTQCPGMVPAV